MTLLTTNSFGCDSLQTPSCSTKKLSFPRFWGRRALIGAAAPYRRMTSGVTGNLAAPQHPSECGDHLRAVASGETLMSVKRFVGRLLRLCKEHRAEVPERDLPALVAKPPAQERPLLLPY